VTSQCGDHRHKEAAGFARDQGKSTRLVERHGAIVLGIDDNGECPNAKAVGTDRGIEDQGSPQPLSLMFDGDREAAHEDGGHERIAREPLCQVGRQGIDGDAGRREGIEAHNGPRVVEGDEASGHAAPHVLQRQLAQIAIEHVDPRAKRRTVVLAAQGFGD